MRIWFERSLLTLSIAIGLLGCRVKGATPDLPAPTRRPMDDESAIRKVLPPAKPKYPTYDSVFNAPIEEFKPTPLAPELQQVNIPSGAIFFAPQKMLLKYEVKKEPKNRFMRWDIVAHEYFHKDLELQFIILPGVSSGDYLKEITQYSESSGILFGHIPMEKAVRITRPLPGYSLEADGGGYLIMDSKQGVVIFRGILRRFDVKPELVTRYTYDDVRKILFSLRLPEQLK